MLVQSVSLYVHPPNPSYVELPWGNYWVLPLEIFLHRGTTAITRGAGVSIVHRGGSPRLSEDDTLAVLDQQILVLESST